MDYSNIKDYVIKFKDKYSYLSATLISIAIIMWFRGIIGILDLIFIRKKTIFNFSILIIMSIIILFIMTNGLDPVFDMEQRKLINDIKESRRKKNYIENENDDFALLSTSTHRDIYF